MQIWQWVHHAATTDDGTVVTADLVRSLLDDEVSRLGEQADERGRALLSGARDVFEHTCLVEDWPQFFTSYAYDTYLVATP